MGNMKEGLGDALAQCESIGYHPLEEFIEVTMKFPKGSDAMAVHGWLKAVVGFAQGVTDEAESPNRDEG